MNNTCEGEVNIKSLKKIRDKWKGNLIIKGLITENDVKDALKVGADGVILSNHGGRQLDPSLTPTNTLLDISKKYKNKITLIMDSGLRSGPNIASSLSCGADFTLLGRTFMYGVGALGKKGGDHTINMLNEQLLQIMKQLRCKSVYDLKNHLIEKSVKSY
tara:strand:- start:1198 stop:1677 length:480 start_codon:yes stop_codon:yes gene_type:complete